MPINIIQVNPLDNVAVALIDLEIGDLIEINNILITTPIPKGHKIALTDLKIGDEVIKYGYPIGRAKLAIKKGEHIHSNNLKTSLSDTNTYLFKQKNTTNNYPVKELSFNGFERKHGEIGIRNELWIVPTVGCVNGIADQMIKQLKKEINPEAIDAIEVFKHNYGCSQLGDDHITTRTILAAIATHPNAGGVLVLGLGCENNQVEAFKEAMGNYDQERVQFLVAQQVDDEIEEGVAILKKLYSKMLTNKRTPQPISKLRVGLKCGGSDGFSGITANPLVGCFSDYLIKNGGTTVLTEVPEMFGAEQILMERAKDQAVFEKTVDLINNFKQYYNDHNQPIYENPSPGNKDGGITTLEEKSLGCVQKGGNETVVAVLNYGEKLVTNGLNLLSGPGNDLVSTTAMGAAGCHLVLFTTGRGTPFGSFIPTLKIATNTALFEKKSHWMDFNAGSILENPDFHQLTESLMDLVIAVSNGKQTNNEVNENREIAIFKTGVTL